MMIPSNIDLIQWPQLSEDAAICPVINDQNEFDKLFYQHGNILHIFNSKNGTLTSKELTYLQRQTLINKRWGFILRKEFHVIAQDNGLLYYHLRWDDFDKKFRKLHDLGTYGHIIITNAIKISNNKLWITCNENPYTKSCNFGYFVIKEVCTILASWSGRCIFLGFLC